MWRPTGPGREDADAGREAKRLRLTTTGQTEIPSLLSISLACAARHCPARVLAAVAPLLDPVAAESLCDRLCAVVLVQLEELLGPVRQAAGRREARWERLIASDLEPFLGAAAWDDAAERRGREAVDVDPNRCAFRERYWQAYVLLLCRAAEAGSGSGAAPETPPQEDGAAAPPVLDMRQVALLPFGDFCGLDAGSRMAELRRRLSRPASGGGPEDLAAVFVCALEVASVHGGLALLLRPHSWVARWLSSGQEGVLDFRPRASRLTLWCGGGGCPGPAADLARLVAALGPRELELRDVLRPFCRRPAQAGGGDPEEILRPLRAAVASGCVAISLHGGTWGTGAAVGGALPDAVNAWARREIPGSEIARLDLPWPVPADVLFGLRPARPGRPTLRELGCAGVVPPDGGGTSPAAPAGPVSDPAGGAVLRLAESPSPVDVAWLGSLLSAVGVGTLELRDLELAEPQGGGHWFGSWPASLRRLVLRDVPVEGPAVQGSLARLVGTSSRLRWLQVSGTHLGGAAVRALLGAAIALPALEGLVAVDCGISAADLAATVPSTTLRHLDLSRNPLGDDGLEALSRGWLASLACLEELVLGAVGGGARGLDSLGRVLAARRPLACLRLEQCRLLLPPCAVEGQLRRRGPAAVLRWRHGPDPTRAGARQACAAVPCGGGCETVRRLAFSTDRLVISSAAAANTYDGLGATSWADRRADGLP